MKRLFRKSSSSLSRSGRGDMGGAGRVPSQRSIKLSENSTSTNGTQEENTSLDGGDNNNNNVQDQGQRPPLLQVEARMAPDVAEERLRVRKRLVAAMNEKEGSFAAIADLILQCKEAVSVYHDGRLPLHCAFLAGCSMEAIVLLAETFPEAVGVGDQDGMIPLHYACRHSGSLDLVKYLLQRHPQGVAVIDDLGRTALHHACCGNAPLSLVELLLHKFPAALTVKDGRGYTPLVVALRHHAGPDVVGHLLNRDTDSLFSNNRFTGATLLHEACAAKSSAEVVALLLERNPSMAESQDRDGRLPLHQACQHAENLRTVIMLTEAFPQGAGTYAHNPGETPLDVARRCHGDTEVARYLQAAVVDGKSVRRRRHHDGVSAAAALPLDKNNLPVAPPATGRTPISNPQGQLYFRGAQASASAAMAMGQDEQFEMKNRENQRDASSDLLQRYMHHAKYDPNYNPSRAVNGDPDHVGAHMFDDSDDEDGVLFGNSKPRSYATLVGTLSAMMDRMVAGGLVFPSLCAFALVLFLRGAGIP